MDEMMKLHRVTFSDEQEINYPKPYQELDDFDDYLEEQKLSEKDNI